MRYEIEIAIFIVPGFPHMSVHSRENSRLFVYNKTSPEYVQMIIMCTYIIIVICEHNYYTHNNYAYTL